ncbi:MAG: DUF3788 domain-containing protein [Clostridiales bacterium]|nr:DUF3788 domain-containing protein [Clostridiales bacterium]
MAAALGGSYKAYQALAQKLPDFGIEAEWRYYNDGKSWLCKNVHKKKTVFWLSAWDGFFKVTLFFNEKNNRGVYELQVREETKTKFTNEKRVGKFMPLLLEVHDDAALGDAYALIMYKQSLK